MPSDLTLLSYNLYGWPVRSVERLPPFSSKQLKNPVLVMGSTVRTSYPWLELNPDRQDFQTDPITPFASARKTANMFGDNAFLLEQLGFGHSTLAQVSACTVGVVNNYFAKSEVSVVSSLMCAGCELTLIDFTKR